MNTSKKPSRFSILPDDPPMPDAGLPAPIPDAFDGAARFDVGQRVVHKLFNYRGLIFDVDATFQGSDEWYENVASTRPPRLEPWYHVLVHDSDHTTYVAERNLEGDRSEDEISHPLTEKFFCHTDRGLYQSRVPAH